MMNRLLNVMGLTDTPLGLASGAGGFTAASHRDQAEKNRFFCEDVTQNGSGQQNSSSLVISITALRSEQIVTSAHEVMLRTVDLLYEAHMTLTARHSLSGFSASGLNSVEAIQKSTWIMQGGFHA